MGIYRDVYSDVYEPLPTSEDRTLAVAAEDRTLSVAVEDRTVTVEG